MNKVYIVCEPTRVINGTPHASMDLSPASEYGETVVLAPYAQSAVATVPMVRHMRDKLRDFKKDDYLLPVGDPVLMCTAAMIAGERTGGQVKFLKWDRVTRHYMVLQVDTSGKAL